jgi:hypothetical protein
VLTLARRALRARWFLLACAYLVFVQAQPNDGTRREWALAGLAGTALFLVGNLYLELIDTLTELGARLLGWELEEHADA